LYPVCQAYQLLFIQSESFRIHINMQSAEQPLQLFGKDMHLFAYFPRYIKRDRFAPNRIGLLAVNRAQLWTYGFSFGLESEGPVTPVDPKLIEVKILDAAPEVVRGGFSFGSEVSIVPSSADMVVGAVLEILKQTPGWEAMIRNKRKWVTQNKLINLLLTELEGVPDDLLHKIGASRTAIFLSAEDYQSL